MLDFRFDAYQTHVVPRAYRLPRQKVMKKHRSMFEVLAHVA
ncbi:unnamed protein product, partial [Brassica rapa subsp. trilocularis]